jgi:DNA-binding transcriptional LysR family regulator
MDDIKYFVTVSETLNVTRAAEIVGISQPAFSYSIKRLEEKLGGELLIRLKNGVRLTKLGEEFRSRARRVLYEWEEAQNLANPETGLVQGSYTFAIHPSVALYTLEHFLNQIRTEFPALNYKFIHGLSREMTERVVSWEADFGIVVNPVKHPDLVIRRLCLDEMTIFHASGAQKRLIFDESLAQTKHIMNRISKAAHFSGTINTPNLEVAAKLASIGLGYGILPTRVARGYANLRKLDGAPVFKDEICLVYRPEKQMNVVGRRIVEIIRAARI